jgi:hypothetical protein
LRPSSATSTIAFSFNSECDITGGALIASNDETKRLVYFHPSDMPELNFPYPRESLSEPSDAVLFEGRPGNLA